MPTPTHVDAHANAMLCPCPIVPILVIPACRLSSSSRPGRASSIQETIHGKGPGGHRRLPLSPSWLPGRALFIKLNIGIDLDNLTTRPDLISWPGLPCHAVVHTAVRGRPCGLLAPPANGYQSRRIAGGRPRPRDTASARLKTCSCRAVRYLGTAPYSTVSKYAGKEAIGSPAGKFTWVLLLQEAIQSTPLHIETQPKSVCQPASQPVTLVGR